MRGEHARRWASPNGLIGADDPRRHRSPTLTRFFTRVMARKMGRDFAAVRWSGTTVAEAQGRSLPDGPVVVYSNHPSWWDPAFLSLVVARLFPERPVYAPIDAKALLQYPFMRRCGLFGIEPGSRAGARRFLDIGARILAQPDAVLCVTPQGGFVDARARPLQLQRGLAHLLAGRPGTLVVPVALDYVFWNDSKPEALARIGRPLRVDGPLSADAWQRELTDALTQTLDALRADSLSRDAARFSTAIDGTLGVGGVYDLWRRVAAGWRGRRFEAGHVAAGRPPP